MNSFRAGMHESVASSLSPFSSRAGGFEQVPSLFIEPWLFGSVMENEQLSPSDLSLQAETDSSDRNGSPRLLSGLDRSLCSCRFILFCREFPDPNWAADAPMGSSITAINAADEILATLFKRYFCCCIPAVFKG